MDAESAKRLKARVNRIAAARSALDPLGVVLLTRRMKSCVVGQGTGTEHPQAKPMSGQPLLVGVQAVLYRFLK